MARTNRKAALAAAPAANVDALDDLNLDDMFNEGDDTLFDGLEIDLDGMGELPNSADKKKGATTKVSQDLDAMKLDLLGDGSSPATADAAAPETSKRRTTKRKIKPPPTMDYDDDEDYEAPKKKRRASKASAKKGKGIKAASKSKAATSTMPPPFSRSTSDPKGVVAVNPQTSSSGNQKKGAAALGQQLARQASGSSVLSTGASSASSLSERPWTLHESTYCGLRPSSTVFYPFMESVPVESTVSKAHRTPLFQKLASCFTGSNQHASNVPSNAKETDGIYRLLSAGLDQMYNDRNTSQSASDQRRSTLGHAIDSARATVAQADKNQLMRDLYSVCFLLKRQYDFLNLNASNMERWCRDNYSPQDFQAVYGHLPTGKRGLQSSSVGMPHRTGSLVASLKSPVVKLKIRCVGFKAPNKPLIAHVRLPRTAVASSKSDSSRTSAAKKRKISSVADADRASISGSSVHDDIVKEVRYPDMKPFQRRHRVADAVTERAQRLELEIKDSHEKHRKSLERQRAEQQKVVDDDEILSLNTMTMWKWLEKSPHFADYSEEDLREVLGSIWEPELENAELLTKPAQTSLRPEGVQSQTPTSSEKRPGDSVFLRLQSLLVDEGSEDEDEYVDEEDDDDVLWMTSDSSETQSEPTKELSSKDSNLIDLSGLSIEERALIHLRAAGLVGDIQAVVGASNGGNGADGLSVRADSRKSGESDMDAVLLAMQTDLVNRHRINNSRLGFLETAGRSHLEEMKRLKTREEENASMVARYNQLLKKQKEAKKNARQKPMKNDSDWVPW